MKKPDRLFQVDRAEAPRGPKFSRAEAQEFKSPLGHQGTKFLALPDDRRRPVVVRVAGPERVEAEPTAAAPPAEEQNVRPGSVVLALEAREVRVVVELPVPRQASLRVEHEVLEDFDASQPELVLLGRLERRFRGEPCVGVRVEVHETEFASRLHARRVAELRVLDVVDRGVAGRRRERSEELVRDRLGVGVAEATSDERLVAVGERLEHVGLLQDVLPLLVADRDTEILPRGELTLDLLDD